MKSRGVKSKKKPIEAYDHKGKKRANNPPVGLVTPQTDPDEGKKKTYSYDPHLDPQLVWAGKAERTRFEIPTVSLHVHERIEPRTILEAVRKQKRRRLAGAGLPLRAARREAAAARGDRLLQAPARLGEPADRRRLAARHELAAREGGAGRAGADDLHRSALRDQVRVKLPAVRRQARRQGPQATRI